MTSDRPIVSTRGEATLEVEPEIVVLRVTVESRDRGRDPTVNALQKRLDATLTRFDGFGDAIESVETATVRIQPHYKDGRPSERITGYAATAVISATISDIERIGDIVSRVSAGDMITVSGLRWALRRDSEAYRRARRAAAADALIRARQYAEAYGAEIDSVVQLADQGLLADVSTLDPVHAPSPMVGAARAAPGSGPPEPAPMDLRPVSQIVQARVEGRFTMTPVDLVSLDRHRSEPVR